MKSWPWLSVLVLLSFIGTQMSRVAPFRLGIWLPWLLCVESAQAALLFVDLCRHFLIFSQCVVSPGCFNPLHHPLTVNMIAFLFLHCNISLSSFFFFFIWKWFDGDKLFISTVLVALSWSLDCSSCFGGTFGARLYLGNFVWFLKWAFCSQLCRFVHSFSVPHEWDGVCAKIPEYFSYPKYLWNNFCKNCLFDCLIFVKTVWNLTKQIKKTSTIWLREMLTFPAFSYITDPLSTPPAPTLRVGLCQKQCGWMK